MKTLATLAASFSLFAVLFVARPASATTTTDCQALIVTLADLTSATTFLRGDKGAKTQSQLLQHLDKASRELDLNDAKEALRQMDGYSTNVTRAVGSATLAAADGAALLDGAAEVVSCIQQIP
jgi:hypothetical protein